MSIWYQDYELVIFPLCLGRIATGLRTNFIFTRLPTCRISDGAQPARGAPSGSFVDWIASEPDGQRQAQNRPTEYFRSPLPTPLT